MTSGGDWGWIKIMRYPKLPVVALVVVVPFVGLWIALGSSSLSADAKPDIPQASMQANLEAPRIAYLTARLLEEYHYQQRPLDTELSQRFF